VLPKPQPCSTIHPTPVEHAPSVGANAACFVNGDRSTCAAAEPSISRLCCCERTECATRKRADNSVDCEVSQWGIVGCLLVIVASPAHAQRHHKLDRWTAGGFKRTSLSDLAPCNIQSCTSPLDSLVRLTWTPTYLTPNIS
jgi:hypothetical protein